MVQDSGADSLRLDIVIQTIAKVQAIDDVSARLQKLSVSSIKAHNSAGLFTGQLEGKMTPALHEAGAALSKLLSTGFGPKFIGSITGVNAALVSAGKTFQNYTKTAIAAGGISSRTAQNFNEISQGLIGVGITGKVTIATFDELNTKLAGLRPRTEEGKAGVTALRNELELLKIQFIEAGNAAEQRFNKPLSQSQKAGQGLLLSFSISQLAAGRLSQAMFGLGFAILFTGKKFLNLTTITVSLGAALTAFVLDKIIASFKKADTVTEQVSKSMERYNLAVDEAKGKTRLLVEEFKNLVESGEDVSLAFEKMIADIEKPLDPDFLSFKWILEPAGEGDEVRQLEQELLRAARAGEDVKQLYEDIRGGFRFPKLEAVSAIDEDTLEGLIAFGASVRAETETLSERITDFHKEIQRAADLKILLNPFEIDRENIDRTFDILSNFSEIHFDELNDIVRGGLADQIEIRRNALQDEQDTIQESLRVETEVIRDALEEQNRIRRRALEDQISIIQDGFQAETDIIRDALDQQIDIIKEQSDAERDIIRDRLDDRIKEIKGAASDEVDAEKEKIDQIKDLERELSRALQDLASERSRITAAIIGSEAELAALERAARAQGVDAAEEQAIIRARIEGLQAEGRAIEDTIDEKERASEGLEAQIEAIEDVIDAINDARDSTIDAARDAADAQIKIAKDAADDEIKIAKRAADDKIDAINDVRDTAITAAKDIADRDIREAQRAAEGVIREAQRAATEAKKAASDRSSDAIKLYQDTADAQIEANNRAHDNAVINFEIQRDNALALLDIDKQRVEEAFKFRDILEDIQEFSVSQVPYSGGSIDMLLRERRIFQRAFIMAFFPDADRAFFEAIGLGGYQFGGVVPGPIGEPQLAIVHGGEEVLTPAQQREEALTPQQQEILIPIQEKVSEQQMALLASYQMPQVAALQPPQSPLLPPALPAPSAGFRDFNLTVIVRNEGDIKKISNIVNKTLGAKTRLSLRTSRGLR